MYFVRKYRCDFTYFSDTHFTFGKATETIETRKISLEKSASTMDNYKEFAISENLLSG